MSRKKMSEDKKKSKIAVSIDKNLSELMEEYTSTLGVKKSKYIENLIKKDFEERGLNFKPDFFI